MLQGVTNLQSMDRDGSVCYCQVVSYLDVSLVPNPFGDHYGRRAYLTNGQLHVATQKQNISFVNFEIISKVSDVIILGNHY